MTIKVEKESLKQKIEGYNPRMFRQMKMVYTILSVFSIIVVIISFASVGFSLYNAQRSFADIAIVEENVLKTNNAVMKMVLDVNNTPAEAEQVYSMFNKIEEAHNDFEELKNRNYSVLSAFISSVDNSVSARFATAYAAINDYKISLRECNEMYQRALTDDTAMKEFQSQLLPIYKKSLEPRMKQAATLMSQAVEEQQAITKDIFFTKAQRFLIVIVLLLIILALGIAAIYIMQRAALQSALELKKRAAEIAKTSEKLTKARDKTKEIAFTNVLTGLKNRYALEEEVGPVLSKNSFYISNFDFDNFRGFNEVYGRNMGDSLLAAVAERLEKDFGEHAEIYNLTSDEFTFVFKQKVSGAQATQMTQRIYEAMSAYYTIDNITVQLNVSGCIYHYVAGEYISVNALLSKMDSVMHQAKNNGGKSVLEVR